MDKDSIKFDFERAWNDLVNDTSIRKAMEQEDVYAFLGKHIRATFEDIIKDCIDIVEQG